MLFLSTQGILGPVTGISASVVAIFLIFGAILYHTGGGETFIELAKLIARDSTGGPAKVAIFSSAFFGTISGSSVANVTVSGIFSIPLMKSMGYKKELAAAVEATASTGGQILPPVMGAGAFIMAELIGRSYLEIATAAILPALLYYIGMTAGVHLKAHRQNLPRIKKEDIPKARNVFAWRRSMGLFVPVTILIYFLIRGYTPATSTFWAIVASVSIYMSSAASWKDLRVRMTKMVRGLEAGAKGIVMVATLVAAAEVIIAMINLTGIGVKVSEFIIGISDRQILVSLIFGMIVCLVLGMGLPTTAAYVLAASVVAPSLISLGIEPLPAHLFVFYFAIISSITPPVCAAVFVASALADANWVRTAFIATQLGLAGFIVPYMFVLSPALLLNGPALEVAQAAVTAIIGVIALAAGAEGYLLRRANLLERAFLLSSAILLIKPGLYTDGGGFLLILVTLALLKFRPGPQLNLAERRLPEMISGKGVVNEKS